MTPEPPLADPQKWPEQLWHSTAHSHRRRYFAFQARTVQLGPISHEKRWQARWKCCMSQLQLGPPLAPQAIHSHVGERGVTVIPVLPQDQNQNMKFIHTRSPLVPRLLTSRLSSPSFLNVLLSHSFRGLLLIFYCSTHLKV